MDSQIWRLYRGSGPLIATAIHDGHTVRKEVLRHLALSDSERLREEDPFTGLWTKVAPTQVIGTHSRFEVDLNRPRETAVYRSPEDAWGLTVWRGDPPNDLFERSLAEYDAFYDSMRRHLDETVQQYGGFLVLDLHSYNHRRQGPHGPEADVAGNPQVNIGTGSLDRDRWAPVVDHFIETLSSFEFPGGKLDVRENVKFRGGRWPAWIHENFPQNGIAIAIEFKKFFMDEWTGTPDNIYMDAIGKALQDAASTAIAAFKQQQIKQNQLSLW